MPGKYAIVTFGCRTNQADSFGVDARLRAEGGERAAPENADLVVVNTCTVTASADQAARRAIRRIARINPTARVVATGCYATRCPSELQLLSDRLVLVPNDRKDAWSGWWPESRPPSDRPSRGGARPGPRPGTGGRTAHALRVQTGCDARCAYCIVPSTRGPSRSLPLESVLAEVQRLDQAGFREVWITGVHLGSWGRDLQPPLDLSDLVRALDRAACAPSCRLCSLEPMDCPTTFIDALAASTRFLPHLHLPLQHASDRVLSAMRRPYSAIDYLRIVQHARRVWPDCAIGADVLVGFPGETDTDVEGLVDFLVGSPLTYLHVFPYSERPGTEAASMRPRVPAAVVRGRAARLRHVGLALANRFLDGQIGRVRPGLTLADGRIVLTDNYLKVRVAAGHPRNQRVRVLLRSRDPLVGEVVP